jgi:hypothetical protein
MAITSKKSVPLPHADEFFIGGQWRKPSSDSVFHAIDASSEERAFSVAEAQAADMDAAVSAAREAFDHRKTSSSRSHSGSAGIHGSLNHLRHQRPEPGVPTCQPITLSNSLAHLRKYLHQGRCH